MKNMNHWLFALSFFIAASWPGVSLAKRSAPKPVQPIIRDGVMYSAPNTDGRIGYVVASDPATGRTLSKTTIFEVKLEPFLEADAQWDFISKLWFDGNFLIVQDERGRFYRVSLATGTVVNEDRHRTWLIWFVSILLAVAALSLVLRLRNHVRKSAPTQSAL
jgi:hypothetical protein